MKAINPINLTNQINQLATSASATGLKRGAYSIAGGVMPIAAIPILAQTGRKATTGLNKFAARVNPTGSVVHSGRHGFVNSKAIGLPMYLNNMRRVK